eukprot:SM004556S16096  [mRNA]  locus=s4556:63:949:- [translate_table: standard]
MQSMARFMAWDSGLPQKMMRLQRSWLALLPCGLTSRLAPLAEAVDIISAIEFDRTGEHLATGDRGGRVVLFERFDSKEAKPRKELEKSDAASQRHIDYRYSTEFQSHEPEFDYLKSLEIEEKINKIRWCQISNGNRFLLSTNDKTIKLWKVRPRAQTQSLGPVLPHGGELGLTQAAGRDRCRRRR